MPSKPASPQKKATGMPCMLPDGEVAGVLKSECASSHSTNSGRPASAAWRATPETLPIDRLWSPPRNTGKAPRRIDW